MSAALRLTRIVSLVAELSRLDREGREAPHLDQLARSFGVPRAEIERDVRTLTLLGDHSDADWLLSLGVWQQGDRLSVSSAGPFRRPVRLSPEELLAVVIALVMDPDGMELAGRFAALMTGAVPERPPWAAGSSPPSRWYDSFAQAVAQSRKISMWYAGEGEQGGTWTIHPYQLVEYRDRTYVLAWSEGTQDWRHFRLDRVVEATCLETGFARRTDFVPITDPKDVFRPSGPLDQVTVRFSPQVARWVRERYPDHEPAPDGGILVRLPVANPAWLVRRVLEYGPDAEVLEPESYREAVRHAVG